MSFSDQLHFLHIVVSLGIKMNVRWIDRRPQAVKKSEVSEKGMNMVKPRFPEPSAGIGVFLCLYVEKVNSVWVHILALRFIIMPN